MGGNKIILYSILSQVSKMPSSSVNIQSVILRQEIMKRCKNTSTSTAASQNPLDQLNINVTSAAPSFTTDLNFISTEQQSTLVSGTVTLDQLTHVCILVNHSISCTLNVCILRHQENGVIATVKMFARY